MCIVPKVYVADPSPAPFSRDKDVAGQEQVQVNAVRLVTHCIERIVLKVTATTEVKVQESREVNSNNHHTQHSCSSIAVNIFLHRQSSVEVLR
jgi:hypothetical protein